VKNLLGEYRCKCLFSKAWVLREAVLMKINMLLRSQFDAEITHCLAPLGTIVKIGMEDKIQQVMTNTVTLMHDILKSTMRCPIGHYFE